MECSISTYAEKSLDFHIDEKEFESCSDLKMLSSLSLYPSQSEVERRFKFVTEMERYDLVAISSDSLKSCITGPISSQGGMESYSSIRDSPCNVNPCIGPLNKKLDRIEELKNFDPLRSDASLHKIHDDRLSQPSLIRAVTDQPSTTNANFYAEFSNNSSDINRDCYVPMVDCMDSRYFDIPVPVDHVHQNKQKERRHKQGINELSKRECYEKGLPPSNIRMRKSLLHAKNLAISQI